MNSLLPLWRSTLSHTISEEPNTSQPKRIPNLTRYSDPKHPAIVPKLNYTHNRKCTQPYPQAPPVLRFYRVLLLTITSVSIGVGLANWGAKAFDELDNYIYKISGEFERK